MLIDSSCIEEVYQETLELRYHIITKAEQLQQKWHFADSHAHSYFNKLNLSYYLALRSVDIRPLQKKLAYLGLSSLSRIEDHVLESIDALLATLERMTQVQSPRDYPILSTEDHSQDSADSNAQRLFGKASNDNHTSIMVTLSRDYTQKDINKLVSNGMGIARINCGHDVPEVWRQMVQFVQEANEKLNKECRMFFDLAGPKIRIKWLVQSSNQQKIQVNDTFLLTGNPNIKISPDYAFQVGVDVPELLDAVTVGDPVLIDDGSIAGEVQERVTEGLLVKVSRINKKKGVRLKTEKGINFPQSDIEQSILTQKDHRDLQEIIGMADIIGVSFVKTKEDMKTAIDIIQAQNPHEEKIPIVAKIETKKGAKHLPEIILSLPDNQPFGVMVARGDLAVETGFKRLGELQQQILWICEAANVPVIWATQVLENLAKTGTPTRSEITDITDGAARADCVMLNKGPYIVDAVILLNELLEIASENSYKQQPLSRSLKMAERVFK
ncbi:hypothetical protein HZY86_08405 [Aerococcaceae bacterium DSM 111020]|nr:hypothetical protein [Aerococcaceae bacterium DSM 111020]